MRIIHLLYILIFYYGEKKAKLLKKAVNKKHSYTCFLIAEYWQAKVYITAVHRGYLNGN